MTSAMACRIVAAKRSLQRPSASACEETVKPMQWSCPPRNVRTRSRRVARYK